MRPDVPHLPRRHLRIHLRAYMPKHLLADVRKHVRADMRRKHYLREHLRSISDLPDLRVVHHLGGLFERK
jgi:hypothetical protein